MFKSQWFSILPFSLMCGILLYFYIKTSIDYTLIWNAIIIVFIALIYKKEKQILLYIILCVLVGYLLAQIRNNQTDYNALTETIFLENTFGTIEKIEHMEGYLRLTLRNVRDFKKIRIVVRTKTYSEISIGDIIRVSMKLSPPPKPVTPNGYDFSRFAYFNDIEAIGFTTTPVQLVKHSKKENLQQYIQKLRLYIDSFFMQNMHSPESSIASALIVGKRERIGNSILDNIRKAGLAHLLAISGLHISLVASLFFVTINYIASRFTFIILKYEIQKISSVFSILASGIYLLISGAPVSAQRAFIMISIFFASNIFNRQSNTIRSVSIAALLIMIIKPESLLQPSFQMSFMAVIALCSFYDSMHNIQVTKKYTLTILLSSFIASAATLPYTLYHFNYFSIGGLISNLLAIPITTFVIIPSGILALIFQPLKYFFLFIMEYGIKILLLVAEYTTHIPYSTIYIHSFNDESLFLMSIGILGLCLINGKAKLISTGIIALGILIASFYKSPDILILKNTIAVKCDDNLLYFLNKNQRRNFITHSWILQNGQNAILTISNADENQIFENNHGYTYRKNNHNILITQDSIFREDSKILDITNFEIPCFVYINKKTIKISGCIDKTIVTDDK